MALVERIHLKRAYELAGHDDGIRYLVDRLWPRGVKTSSLRLDAWLRDVAPSDSLRRWFGHDPSRWVEFQSRYFSELDEKPEAWQPILDAAKEGIVTLVFAASDSEVNHAVALRQYLDTLSATTAHARDGAGERRNFHG